MLFFVSCGKGLEYLLVDECLALGAKSATPAMAGVNVEGTQEDALRLVMHSRLASRVLWPLHSFDCPDEAALYAGASQVDWGMQIAQNASIAVDAHVSGQGITHAQFAAQRVKDAVVDTMRREFDSRPNVDLQQPDVRIHLVIRKNKAILSIDMGTGPLHRRGWRQHQGEAPLKETLAAAMLMRGGWSASVSSGALLDPMCGAGTLLIEGALMAADVAPGIARYPFGEVPTKWLQLDRKAWKRVVDDATERADAGMTKLSSLRFIGRDSDERSIRNALKNAELAGVAEFLDFQVGDVDGLKASLPSELPSSGVVVCNPPYDARLQADPALYRRLGNALRVSVPDWTASLLCGDMELAKATGLRATKKYQMFNGTLECMLIVVRPIQDARQAERPLTDLPALSDGAQMVANRIRKNQRKLKSWLAKDGIHAYRIYDADLPEYAAAIDVYNTVSPAQTWLHVQEYAPPASVPEETARHRLKELLAAVRDVFGVTRDFVSVKTRARGKGGSKYGQMDHRGEFLTVREGDALLRVNLFDYLDTGLFLDHRPIRTSIAEVAEDKHFLNLFAYTGAATVHAALGGAASTTTVDLSATYLQWCVENLQLNGLTGRQHRMFQADVMAFLREDRGMYDLIFLDPPTFSNSKRAQDFDVQLSHVEMLKLAMRRLSDDGVLIFSNNFRRFKLDEAAVSEFADIEEITPQTIGPDFERDARIHRCWRLTHR